MPSRIPEFTHKPDAAGGNEESLTEEVPRRMEQVRWPLYRQRYEPPRWKRGWQNFDPNKPQSLKKEEPSASNASVDQEPIQDSGLLPDSKKRKQALTEHPSDETLVLSFDEPQIE